MKRFVLASLLFAATAAFAQVSVGIRIGPPPPPRVVAVRPVAPGPGWNWVDGYWYPVSNRYVWHEGYWTRTPYEGARWIAPRHDNGRWFDGYWEGDRGRIKHNHKWDREDDRDWRGRGRGHDR